MKKFLPTLILLTILAYLPLTANHLSASLLFTARLNGAQEVPEVTTDAQGVAMFSLDQRHNTIYINAQFTNLSGAITGAHIHEGAPGENGGVVIDLSAFLSGNKLKGAIRDIDATTVANMLNGRYYINVHTDANPGGEIRGQIGLETDTRYSAILNGNNEVPAVASNGAGVAVFHLNHDRNAGINFKILFQGLSSDVTGAHIHQAAAGQNGGVVFDLEPYIQGNRIEGTWDAGALLDALLAGDLYINIHTVNNPGGEIRGQLELLPGFTFDASLTGSQEVPAVTSPADGLGIITVDPATSQVNYYIVYDSIVGAITGAHFHAGATGSNGGVVINLQDGINGNVISGSADIDLDLFNAMLRAGLYVNIHSAAHPGGEIRGQVLKFAREGFTFEMNGGQEVPPVTSPASGAGMVSIGRDQTNVHYMIVYSGLTNTFTGAHFHSGSPGTNGNVIYDLTNEFNSFGGAYGYWNASSDPPFTFSPIFLSNDVYVNIHTDANPGGEIRGNIIRSSDIFTEIPFDPEFGDNLLLSAILTGDDEVPPVTTTAAGLATLYFEEDKNNATLNLTVTGLSGEITGAHIHEGDAGTTGPVLFPLTTEGNRAHQEIADINDIDLISLLNGATYVNVHTAANPNGEIRGQLVLEQDVALVGFLAGANEVPAVTTDAVGLTVVNYTQGQLAMDVKVQWTGLSSPVTGAHFHSGQPGENGPVLIDLSDFIEGNRIETRIELTIDELIEFAFNNVYLNVHTENNPGGEIRTHLTFLPGITFDGWMSPLQEVPFTTSEASGLVVGTLYPGPNDLALWMVVDNVSGPVGAAHIHNAPMLENGGVVHDLSADIVGNSIQHIGLLDAGLAGEMLSGDLYINAHTAAFPGGELRGQLIRNARDGYGFDLCTEQEVGTVNAPGATGSGLVSIDRLHKNINISVVADGLTGPITSSHIHSAPIGVNGSVIADLTDFYVDNAMFLAGAEADTAILNAVLSGDTYINVHTAAHPGGEIRGQIVKDLLCELEVGVDPLADLINEVTLSPVPVVDQLKVGLNILEAGRYDLAIVDVTGRLISNETYDFSNGDQEVVIEAQELLPGFYSLVISNGRAAQAFKFVK